VLHAASDIDCFLGRDTCVSSTQLNRPILSLREPNSTLKLINCKKCSLSNSTSILIGKNMLDAPVFNTDSFLSRDTCVSSPQLKN
jgi:hypothetical protein